MNILVTGGAGYIGSHAVRFLTERGHQVWVFDNLSTGHPEAVSSDRLIQGELRDEATIAKSLQEHRIDSVMHFAACALVGESVVDPEKYYQNNVVGTLTLLRAMRAAGVSRFVFSSTAATYGTPERSPITEKEAQQPINPYGRTKLLIEEALRDYSKAYGWSYAALRYFNAAGAARDGKIGEDHDPETHLIPLILQVALGQRAAITIFGDDYETADGTCIRDYIHVEDLAAAHLAALERLSPGVGLEMNLGTGRGHSVREVVDACHRVSGHSIPITIGPRRPGDPAVLVADSTLAQRELSWSPEYTSLERIVATAWNWHRHHPRGYRG